MRYPARARHDAQATRTPVAGERQKPVVELDLAGGRVVVRHQRPSVVEKHLVGVTAGVGTWPPGRETTTTATRT